LKKLAQTSKCEGLLILEKHGQVLKIIEKASKSKQMEGLLILKSNEQY